MLLLWVFLHNHFSSNFWRQTRVTRLGEFSSFRRLVTLGNFFNHKSSKKFVEHFSGMYMCHIVLSYACVYLDKMDWATFWSMFSQNRHLVTLKQTDNGFIGRCYVTKTLIFRSFWKPQKNERSTSPANQHPFWRMSEKMKFKNGWINFSTENAMSQSPEHFLFVFLKYFCGHIIKIWFKIPT
jgi:hypothetical protein